MNYFTFNERKGKPGPFDHPVTIKGDTVDFPAMQVTEEPWDDDSQRRYLSAEQRLALELIP